MEGINLNKNIVFKKGSLRYFNPGEHHCRRLSRDNVLLLVFDGVLRFSEDGVPYEIKAGEYYIQKEGLYQEGNIVSDTPCYFYAHIDCEWGGEDILEKRGSFDIEKFMPLLNRLDRLAHDKAPYILKAEILYGIINRLSVREDTGSVATEIEKYIQREYSKEITLEELCDKFNFSKNHRINLFKAKYGVTPFAYLNYIRIKDADRILVIMRKRIKEIMRECGFNNYSHFFRLFREKNKVSPLKWRQLNQV